MKAVVAAAEREPERFGNLVEEMDRLRRVNGVYRKLIVGGKVAAIRAAPRGWPTSPATASASRGASMMFLATSTDGDSTRARATWQYVPSGAAQAITADGLRDLYWTVRAPHRGNAVWVMSSATANAVDKLKSGTGNYLWRDASSSSVPPMLLGRPVQFDVNMPAVWGGNCPIAFVFSGGYLIVDHAGLKFLRDAYSDKPHVHIYFYRRTGGGVALTECHQAAEDRHRVRSPGRRGARLSLFGRAIAGGGVTRRVAASWNEPREPAAPFITWGARPANPFPERPCE